ncbi:transcription factor IBH1 [Neltuma alba]|uniref:transcription factor IBH1 n=1 Tax=Neltuma alba TaxID=207710 RepID=UPI0010A43EE9|nr:transcription factor IBH1 [Prosopis alba]XP_028759669.1 transcription factor IBH1 [Prosopis alba]
MTPSDGTIITATNPRTEMKFARRFLRSLSKTRKIRPPSSSSSICVKKRSERIKMAAYWCMARAVGSRRAWSRAILMKLSRGRQHHHHCFSMTMMKTRMRRKNRSTWLGKVKKKKKEEEVRTRSPSPYDEDDDEEGLMKRQTQKLREVVPGGKSMDICSLLEETAHFVTCLAAQVHVMQTIAHHYS